MGTQPLPKKGAEPTIFGPCLLWPNGRMDQDATWYGGRPRPRHHCVRQGPNPPPKKGAQSSPIFGLCLLRPHSWMDQDASWYGGGPQSMPHCARCGPSSRRKKGESPQFLAHVYCGQTAGWIKMPLGTEIDLHPGGFVLDGDPAHLPKKGRSPPIFGPCLLYPNCWMDQDDTWHGGGPWPRQHCVRWNPAFPQKGGGAAPNFRPMSIVVKRLYVSGYHLVQR